MAGANVGVLVIAGASVGSSDAGVSSSFAAGSSVFAGRPWDTVGTGVFAVVGLSVGSSEGFSATAEGSSVCPGGSVSAGLSVDVSIGSAGAFVVGVCIEGISFGVFVFSSGSVNRGSSLMTSSGISSGDFPDPVSDCTVSVFMFSGCSPVFTGSFPDEDPRTIAVTATTKAAPEAPRMIGSFFFVFGGD